VKTSSELVTPEGAAPGDDEIQSGDSLLGDDLYGKLFRISNGHLEILREVTVQLVQVSGLPRPE
jgi:hypothetical protein